MPNLEALRLKDDHLRQRGVQSPNCSDAQFGPSKSWQETTRSSCDEIAKAALTDSTAPECQRITALTEAYDDQIQQLKWQVKHINAEKERAEDWLEMTEGKLAKEKDAKVDRENRTHHLEKQLEAVRTKMIQLIDKGAIERCKAEEKIRNAEENVRAAKAKTADAESIAAAAVTNAEHTTTEANRKVAAMKAAVAERTAEVAAKTQKEIKMQRMLADRAAERRNCNLKSSLQEANSEIERLREANREAAREIEGLHAEREFNEERMGELEYRIMELMQIAEE